MYQGQTIAERSASNTSVLSVNSDQIQNQVMNLLGKGIDFAMNNVIPVVLNNNILLAGVVLLVIALVVQILNGLLDWVVYTALAGGFALLIGGIILISI